MEGGKEDDRRRPALVTWFRRARARAQRESCEGDRGGDGSEHPPAAHVTAPLTRLTFSRERGSDTTEAGVKYVAAYAARGLREPERLRDRDASGTRERL